MAEEVDELHRQVLGALTRRAEARRTGELPRPIRAMALAIRFGVRLDSGRDSRRRGVRLIIARLREQGHPIATDGDGYWLAITTADHAVHQDYLRRNGLHDLAAASRDKHSPAASDAAGQIPLF